MGVKTYDPSQVSIIFGGHPVSGFADGTFISIEQTEDSFTLAVGTDGEACRSKTSNRSARVTLTLGQWSLSNDFLAAQHNLDVISPSGDGIVPFIMKDNSGRTICAAEKSWIVKPATVEMGREPGSREWVIETDNMLMQVGGN